MLEMHEATGRRRSVTSVRVAEAAACTRVLSRTRSQARPVSDLTPDASFPADDIGEITEEEAVV